MFQEADQVPDSPSAAFGRRAQIPNLLGRVSALSFDRSLPVLVAHFGRQTSSFFPPFGGALVLQLCPFPPP